MAELKEARVPDIGDFEGVPVIEVLVAPGDTVEISSEAEDENPDDGNNGNGNGNGPDVDQLPIP